MRITLTYVDANSMYIRACDYERERGACGGSPGGCWMRGLVYSGHADTAWGGHKGSD